MNLRKKIENYLLLEFAYSWFGHLNFAVDKKMLLESHGSVSGIDDYVNAFEKKIEINTKEMTMFGSDSIVFTVTKEDFPFDTFFDVFDCQVNIKVADNDLNGVSGGYVDRYSGFYDGKYVVKMYINYSGPLVDASWKCGKFFSHEITHAYEDYGRNTKGGESFEDYKERTGYSNIARQLVYGNDNDLKTAISNVLYYISDTEIRASVAEMRREIQHGIRFVHNNDDAMELLNRTSAWENYEYVEDVYVTLYDRLNKKEYENFRKNVISCFNELTGYNAKTYNQVVKYIGKQVRKFGNKIFDNGVKMLSDEMSKIMESTMLTIRGKKTPLK